MIGKTRAAKVDDITDEDNNFDSRSGESNFIFYGDKQFEEKIVIYVNAQNIKKRENYFVNINVNSDLREMRKQISSRLSSIHELKDLSGLKIVNLKKNTKDKGTIKIPKEGRAHDYIQTGDIIYCEVEAKEFWVPTHFKLTNNFLKISVKADYKIPNYMTFHKMKLFLLKCGIDLFLKGIKEKKNIKKFSYFVENIKLVIGKTEYSFESDEMTNTPASRFLTFSSDISLTIKFGVFEQLIFNKLKVLIVPGHYCNTLRLNEFKEMEFDEFNELSKYTPEQKAIFKLSASMLLNDNSNFFIILRNFIDHSKRNQQDDTGAMMSSDESNIDVECCKTPKVIIFFPYKTNQFTNYHSHSNISTIQRPTTHSTRTNKKSLTNKNVTDLSSSETSSKKKHTQKRKHIKKNYQTFIEPSILQKGFDENLLVEQYESPKKKQNDDMFFFGLPRNKIDSKDEEEENEEDFNQRGELNELEEPTFLESVRDSSKFSNLSQAIQKNFTPEAFYNEIQSRSKFTLTYDMIKYASIPESRDIEYLDEVSIKKYKSLGLENIWDNGSAILINNGKILLFVFLVFIYFISMMVVINLNII